MQVKNNIFIKIIANLTIGLIIGFIFQTSAFAEADPPSRVARLSYFNGSVTFAPAGSDDWAYAYLNRPLTTGDRLWVDQGGRSELQLGSTGLRLNSQTSLDLMSLDDNNTQLKLTQGTLNVHIRDLFDDESFEVDTPNLAFSIKSPGDYRIDVDPTYNTTTVTVRNGNGNAFGDGGGSFPINSNQQVKFGGTELIQARADSAPPADDFDRWVSDRNRRQEKSTSTKYVSREVIGSEDLDSHGTWREEAGYGAVWVPRVTIVNWAPYRYGHWAWIAPWGWTWVDDAPWGFAPFHYGRWAWIRSSWAWVPGPIVRRPVYAPALVAFAGSSRGGVSWGISLSVGLPGVAWFPLAPGEAYRPAYRASRNYITNVNKTVIVNKTVNVTKNVYINRNVNNAVTAVPASAFVKGQAVQKNNVVVRRDQLNNINMNSTPALAPVKQSLVGQAKAANSMPPREIQNRQVMATRSGNTPAAYRDTLAEKFAKQNGTAPGTGPALQTGGRNHENAQVSVIKPTNYVRKTKETRDNDARSNDAHGNDGWPSNNRSNNVPRPPSKVGEGSPRSNFPTLNESNVSRPAQDIRNSERDKNKELNKPAETRKSYVDDRNDERSRNAVNIQRNNNTPHPAVEGERRVITTKEHAQENRSNISNEQAQSLSSTTRRESVDNRDKENRRNQEVNREMKSRSESESPRQNQMRSEKEIDRGNDDRRNSGGGEGRQERGEGRRHGGGQ